MDEFKFVMKCLLFSVLFLVLTQIKTNDISIENRIQSSLVNSQVSDFVNKTSDGGVKLIKDVYTYAVDHYNVWKRSGNSSVSPTPTSVPQKQLASKQEPIVQAVAEPNTEDVEPVIEETE